MQYKTVEKWYEPADMLRNKSEFLCEMSRDDHGFLCGAVKTLRPHKVVEIGVAEGGTTSVLMNALSMCVDQCDVISVDLNEKFYLDSNYTTGYQYEKMKRYIDFSECSLNHIFLLGKTIAERIEEIGADIDLVIIDTTHRLPGEILDFLCVLPYINGGGWVILHDVDLNYRRSFNVKLAQNAASRIATKLLLTVARGNKYLEVINGVYANIGAIEINEQTRENVADLFVALSATWGYTVSKSMLLDYRRIFEKHYAAECLQFFDVAAQENGKIYSNMEWARLKNSLDDISANYPYGSIPYGSKIAIYGSGKRADSLRMLALITDYLELVICVDDTCADGRWLERERENVQSPDALRQSEFEFVIVSDEDESIINKKKEWLMNEGIAGEEQILTAVSGIKISTKLLSRCRFPFPYSGISPGVRVCLYGAGNCGREFYNTIKLTQYCELVGWVDRSYQNIANEMVTAPETMATMNFDYVLIGISDRSIYEDAKGEIERNGWNCEKPIIGIWQ